MANRDHCPIIIIDYGSQYGQLIARRVREANVYCELHSWQTPAAELTAKNPKGFILSGGHKSVYDPDAPELPAFILESGLPILGICYGMQLLAHNLGGKVAGSPRREYGLATLQLNQAHDPLFANWLDQPHSPNPLQVWMSHSDEVKRLPASFTPLAHTDHAPYAAAADLERGYYAVQFHPEVTHTPQGKRLLKNFAVDICGCRQDWTPANFIDHTVTELQHKIGDKRALMALSGGVDSAVAATLLHQAIGSQLHAVFVDHGMLRKDEGAQVIQTFRHEQGMQLTAVNRVEEYLDELRGVIDPEQKRKIIGEKFVRIFEREAKKLGEFAFLGQGTIYPDVIESASHDNAEAKTIKTHHNVGGLPANMAFELVEPLRQLFKDEVRRVGLALGLPDAIVWRQPFPGPGLAIRCLGEISWERLERLRAADAIYLEELENAGMLRGDTQQAFAVLLPVKSVGVMGDGRTYEEALALRAVTTEDFMTADWARLPAELLARVSRRIVNEVAGINRVVYDITSKPPGTIEWE